MLELLAQKHAQWQRMALGICKDKYLADDLVSEMYLKLATLDKVVTDGYVYFTLKSVHIDWIRKNKNIDELTTDIAFEAVFFGEEPTMPPMLSWLETQIVTLRQSHSLRKIALEYDMNYCKIFRVEKIARQKIELWLKRN